MDTFLLKRMLSLSLVLFASLFLFGFEKERIDTEQGYYLVSVEFMQTPVKVGRNSMKLTIYDKRSKGPVQKMLDIEVVPWMPKHEHSTTEIPVVKEQGNGEYLVEKLNFSMSGDWEVYIKIKRGRSEDTAVFNVNVVK